ncbi:MAG: GAF domain-containing protein, partial [Nitrospirota bacterium]|nr:GAF domain-containing protein [Nitrospirota bacterium]
MDDCVPSAHADGDVARYRTLLEVAESIARHVEVEAVVHDLAHRLPRVAKVNVIGLSLYNAERRAMRLHTIQANIPADVVGGHEWGIDECPDGWVWHTQQALLIPDLEQEPRWPKVVRLMQEDNARSLCVVPLTTAVRRLGAIGFGSVQKNAYDEADVEFLLQVGK